jgi:hypothetical protein
VHNVLNALVRSSVLTLFLASVSSCAVPESMDRDASISPLARADREARHSVPLPYSLFIPEGLRMGSDMRDYIESPEFGAFDSLASMIGHPEDAFNEIYFEALAMAHGNLTDGFLAASYGSFEHEFIPLVFFGAELDLPLTSEDHSHFLLRVSHLPAQLYRIPEGDRDKLQHFFASAWLKSLLGMDWLVQLAGEGVEEGESLFVIGDARDPRDIHANNDGRRFAVRAAKNIEHVPSASLTPNP